MQKELMAASVAVFGSGWGWLCYDKHRGTLRVVTTKNQDTPYEQKLYPIVAVDVWEHAYYLDYTEPPPRLCAGCSCGHMDWEHASGIFRNLVDGGVDTPF